MVEQLRNWAQEWQNVGVIQRGLKGILMDDYKCFSLNINNL